MTKDFTSYTKGLFIAAALICTVSIASAQLVVDNTQTVETYVNEFLLGEGVTAFNLTFNGFDAASATNVQIGSFNGENTVLGMDEGLILASGGVDVAVGPNDIGSASVPSTNPGAADADLQALIPGFSINDVAVLEFDFIPSGDTVRFNYIWGSEEYPEWVNSSFNDVFGFFISGPGINGIYSNNAENIALIPGTDLPVTIDNVNAGLNAQYYVDNTGGSGQENIQFDGYTVVLEAVAAVQCGQVYHIKIALADAGDSAFDSGVFLEKGSFVSVPTIEVEASPVNSGLVIGPNDFSDGVLAGCSDARFCLFRDDTVGVDTSYFSLSGSAIPGVQYVMPEEDFVVFQEGEDTICIDIVTLVNDLGAQVDSIEFSVFIIDPCSGDSAFASASLAIYNEYSFDVFTENVGFSCPLETVDISASASGGLSPYSYQWALQSDPENVIGEGTSLTVDAPDGGSQTYIVTVTDDCGLAPEFGTLTVTNNTAPDPIVDTSPNDTVFCLGQSVELIAYGQNGQGDLTYSWNTGDDTPNIEVTPDGFQNPVYYYVSVTDSCGISANDSVAVYVLEYDPIAVEFPEYNSTCPGDVQVLSPQVSGGAGSFVFEWQDGTMSPSLTVSPANPGPSQYGVVVTDLCGNIGQGFAVVNVPLLQPIIATPNSVPSCTGEAFTLSISEISGGAGNSEDDYIYTWVGPDGNVLEGESEIGTLSLNNPEPGIYTVNIVDICGTQASYDVVANLVGIEGIPNVITPHTTPDQNDEFIVPGSAIFDTKLTILNRWGKVVYEESDYRCDRAVLADPSTLVSDNNCWDGEDFKADVYYYILDIDNGTCTFQGTLHILGDN